MSLTNFLSVGDRRSTKLNRAWLAILLACVALSGGPAFAQNGTVDFTTPLCGNGSQSAGIDLAYDTFTNTVWVLDQATGQICQYSLSAFPPDVLFSTSVNHPFGPQGGLPNFLPLCTGFTYNPSTQNFYVLATVLDVTMTPILEIATLNSAGVEVAPRFTPSTLPGSNISGLAYDTVAGSLWTRDLANGLALELNATTGAIVSQVTLPGDPTTYGQGLSFTNDGGVRTLEFSRGNVLDFRPTEMVRIDAVTGAELCLEVDLSQVPDPVLGIVRPPTGSVVYATTATDIYKIDATQPTLTPPSNLACFNNVDGTVSLSWTNCGNGAAGLYSSIRVLRDGGVIEILAGNVTNFTDSNPTPVGALINYEVVGVEGAITSPSSCSVQTGAGGLVSYNQFDGSRPYDLALDPALGELFVTDNFSDRIYVYDTDLNLLRVLATGIPNLQAVAFNSTSNELIVSNSGTTLLQFVDPFSGAAIGSILPVPTGSTPLAITYDALNDHYIYVDDSSDPDQAVRIDADPNALGNLIGTFTPPAVTGLAFGRGICHLAASDTFLFPMQVGGASGAFTSVSELFTNGFPTGFAFPTAALGGSIDNASNAIRGIEDFANILFVAGAATNTIFRVLIAPGGASFVRGDANQDMSTPDLADALFIANYIFANGAVPPCLDAADVNDDGVHDISDPLYLIRHLFIVGSPPPPAPFPTAGPDPTFLDPFPC